jgi:hypothetical protein
MDTYPAKAWDERIFLITPYVDIKNLKQIDSILPVRKLTREERSNYKIYYDLITETYDGFPAKYTTMTGIFNKDSSLEIVSFQATNTNAYTLVKVKLRFSCKLYDSIDRQIGEIKSAELAGKIYIMY